MWRDSVIWVGRQKRICNEIFFLEKIILQAAEEMEGRPVGRHGSKRGLGSGELVELMMGVSSKGEKASRMPQNVSGKLSWGVIARL